MDKKQDLRIQKTYKLLSQSLIQLLERKPFDEIKLNEICDLAMVHKTTFYNHFTDKYDLLKYTISFIQNEMLEKLDCEKENKRCSESLLDHYCNLAKLYMSNMKQNQGFYRSILLNEVNNICTDLFYQMFLHDLENKIGSTAIPIHYVSIFYVSGVFATINEWFKKGMKESEDTMIHYLKTMIENKEWC